MPKPGETKVTAQTGTPSGTPGTPGTPGANGLILAQVQACQRRVAELRGSLALLAERCGSLEEVHEGAKEKLRAFGSSKTTANSPEQLKKQSAARVRGLQGRHSELMTSLQQVLAGADTWDTLKQHAEVKLPSDAVKESDGPFQPVVETGSQPDNSAVKVMQMDGPAAKLSSRLRCLAGTPSHEPRALIRKGLLNKMEPHAGCGSSRYKPWRA